MLGGTPASGGGVSVLAFGVCLALGGKVCAFVNSSSTHLPIPLLPDPARQLGCVLHGKHWCALLLYLAACIGRLLGGSGCPAAEEEADCDGPLAEVSLLLGSSSPRYFWRHNNL